MARARLEHVGSKNPRGFMGISLGYNWDVMGIPGCNETIRPTLWQFNIAIENGDLKLIYL